MLSLESFRWASPGRFIPASILVIALVPVIRTSSRTRGNSPQNVKKIVVCMPYAAPVEPRMRVGQILSRSPLHATIVIRSGAASVSPRVSSSAIRATSFPCSWPRSGQGGCHL